MAHMQHICSQVRLVEKDPFATSGLNKVRGWFSLQPSFVRSAYSQEMATLVQQFSEEWKPDRIVAFTFVMGVYALEVGGVPKLIDVDNFMSRMLFEAYLAADGIKQKARRFIAWRKFLKYEKWLYHQFECCLVVTDKDRGLLNDQLRLNPERISVIPNGVDTAYNFPTYDPTDANSLVFNGSLVYQANFDAIEYFLSEIFPAVYDVNPSICLNITGRYDGVSVEKLVNTERVNFTGYLEDIRPVVRNSWVCVVPLRIGGGTRLKVLEAMALGTPVVSTSKGAEGLDVSPGKHILIADEPGEFATQIIQLLNNPQLRQYLSMNASALVKEKYEWGMIGERFSTQLEQISS
jgi:glycosyltransferase involved in cell wall biosynthesis